MKKLKWVVIGVLAVVVLAVVLVIVNLNSIVRAGVETASTSSLGLKTTLGGASVSLLGGSVGLSDFKVASPSGFTAPAFLDIGGLGLTVGYSELRSDPIRIASITVDRPRLVIEQRDLKLNLVAVSEALPPSDPASKPPNLIVGQVSVRGAEVVIKPGIPGLSSEIAITLPDLVVRDIGSGDDAQNGVAIKQVVLTGATEMARQAADSDKLPPEVRALLTTDLNALKGKLKGELGKKIEDLKGQARDAADKAAQDAQKAVEKGLGGLLNKPK